MQDGERTGEKEKYKGKRKNQNGNFRRKGIWDSREASYVLYQNARG